MLRYTFRQLEYFVAVGETGSIARAAAKLNVSSPSISAAIAQLEKEFALPLFVRQHAQGLSLTRAGRRMFGQAKTVLREAGAMLDLAADISGAIRGPLAIGCLVTFAQVVLPTLRRSFEDAHAEVRVGQRELDQLEILSGLRRAEIDVALTYDLDVPTDLIFETLVALPPYVVVGETHPLAHLPAVSPQELRDHPMVLLDLPHSADYFLSLFDEFGARPEIAERTRDMSVMRSLVGAGYGYSIANIRPLNDRSPDGRPLKLIPMTGKTRPMRMGLLTARDADASHVVRAFIDHCRAAAKAGLVPGVTASSDGVGFA